MCRFLSKRFSSELVRHQDEDDATPHLHHIHSTLLLDPFLKELIDKRDSRSFVYW